MWMEDDQPEMEEVEKTEYELRRDRNVALVQKVVQPAATTTTDL